MDISIDENIDIIVHTRWDEHIDISNNQLTPCSNEVESSIGTSTSVQKITTRNTINNSTKTASAQRSEHLQNKSNK